MPDEKQVFMGEIEFLVGQIDEVKDTVYKLRNGYQRVEVGAESLEDFPISLEVLPDEEAIECMRDCSAHPPVTDEVQKHLTRKRHNYQLEKTVKECVQRAYSLQERNEALGRPVSEEKIRDAQLYLTMHYIDLAMAEQDAVDRLEALLNSEETGPN
jgi:hypothetical protein